MDERKKDYSIKMQKGFVTNQIAQCIASEINLQEEFPDHNELHVLLANARYKKAMYGSILHSLQILENGSNGCSTTKMKPAENSQNEVLEGTFLNKQNHANNTDRQPHITGK